MQTQRFDPVTIRYRETGGTGAKPYAGNFYVSRVVTVALRSDGGSSNDRKSLTPASNGLRSTGGWNCRAASKRKWTITSAR
jgi:hypothetical protein